MSLLKVHGWLGLSKKKKMDWRLGKHTELHAEKAAVSRNT